MKISILGDRRYQFAHHAGGAAAKSPVGESHGTSLLFTGENSGFLMTVFREVVGEHSWPRLWPPSSQEPKEIIRDIDVGAQPPQTERSVGVIYCRIYRRAVTAWVVYERNG